MKRRLTGLRLDKIAAVDRPCQEHATMTIMKRAADPQPDNKGDPDMSDLLQKKVDDLTSQLADLTTKYETSTSALVLADALAKMSDKEKTYLAGLKDEDAKKQFTAMKAEDRVKLVNKAVDNDEVVKVGDREIRKSVVGEDVFAIMKVQADEIEKNKLDIAKERDTRVMAELAKRADEVYPHVPGTTDERAGMLKAIGDIKDEKVRKSFEAVFAQSEALAKTAFTTAGHGHGAIEGSPDAELQKLAEAEAKKSSITIQKAMDVVLRTDQGKVLYEKSLVATPAAS